MADVVDKDTMKNYHIASEKINPETSRYPYCIVWTPIPVLSWVTAVHSASLLLAKTWAYETKWQRYVISLAS